MILLTFCFRIFCLSLLASCSVIDWVGTAVVEKVARDELTSTMTTSARTPAKTKQSARGAKGGIKKTVREIDCRYRTIGRQYRRICR